VERHLVQILVVVANSQLETLAAEVEKGSLTTAIGQGLRGTKRQEFQPDSLSSRAIERLIQI